LTVCSLASHAVVAQRDPVLKQVRVPHSYYYREMYLPQVTSGPNAVSWSPDGRDVVYAMAGMLWRQSTLRARSLTARHPILDRYAFATTSPIYVIVGDDPIRSTTDARYFLAWIGRLEQAVAEHQAWNGPDEKRAVLESLERARSVYQERAHESEPQGRR
jgi:hypothetical protein